MPSLGSSTPIVVVYGGVMVVLSSRWRFRFGEICSIRKVIKSDVFVPLFIVLILRVLVEFGGISKYMLPF